jgi:uncharacterized protein (DUF305 family)
MALKPLGPGHRLIKDNHMPQHFTAPRFWSVYAVFLAMGAAAAWGQQQPQPENSVPLIMPGAPGKPDKILAPGSTAGTGQQGPTEADVKFMQGMIMHHTQAVEMVALMPGRTTNPQLMEFGKRISISQTDEINWMKRWLTNRNKPISEMGDMAGMNMGGMSGMAGMGGMEMPLMPGMLTTEQMDALRKAKGAAFDHLFLTGMIQHHTGALTMVTDLFNTPSAGQDPQLFDFTADVSSTQEGEINAMQDMLAKEKK